VYMPISGNCVFQVFLVVFALARCLAACCAM
jgi:hypothetical protein